MKFTRMLASIVGAIALLTAPVSKVHAQCAGDVIADGIVNGVDLAQMLADWGGCSNCPSDINQDGLVNGMDLGQLLASWGTCQAIITGVVPSQGTIIGGTAITISGNYLAGALSVTIGGVAATNLVVVSTNAITAIAPAGPVGSATVAITTPGGTTTAIGLYSYASSSILSIVPSTGATNGGGAITISGNYLAGASSVTIGGVPATNLVVVSSTVITAVTPAGSVGPADVVVTTPAGTLTSVGGFTYFAYNTPAWATLIEGLPDPAVVTDPALRAAIVASGFAWRVLDTSTNIEMVLIPPGSFTMGCSHSSPSWTNCSDELPTHTVTLTNAFYLGRYEVTQAQWTAKMGSNPSQFQGPSYPDAASRPVELVSWPMIASFNTASGMRLPTEAEWEYAYRAQLGTAVTRTAYHNGTNDVALLGLIAWFDSNSGSQTHAVGGKPANALGLHDMSGNVYERVNDWYGVYDSSPATNPTGPSSGTYRVGRGGSWLDNHSGCRASSRGTLPPVTGHSAIGFRAARTP